MNKMNKIVTEFIKSKMADGLAQTTIDSYCYALKDFWQYFDNSHLFAL